MTSLTRPVAIAGVGYSELSRKGEPHPYSLAIAAATAALSDAGLRTTDIDGMFEYKFGPESPGAQDMARLLGVPDLAAFADIMASNPSGLAGPLAGVMAVASGVCETVLVFRCLTRAAGHQGGVAAGPDEIGGRDQFLTPYGYLGGILVNLALKKRRWMDEYRRPEDDFGHIAVNARRWSALNPRAVLRDELTMDDYLSSRMVVDPLRVLDCDYPVNGAVATVITTAERAKDLRQPAVLVDAMTYATGRGADWVFDVDFLYGGMFECAKRLWQRSSLTMADIDVAQLYDGFTPVTVGWIEALGACGRGEFGDWVGDGSRLAPGGDFPLNTAGGQLAEGRLHGIGFLNEAVLQLRGQCDQRQIPGARTAVVASGVYPQCAAMVLTAV
ncbi:thiolase family protein [Mycobacterium sp. OTB74]|jgi:acetyl-CoA acetyltransferase|uniref:thiolase C-terminal domain-containing protein n=1 Tax=Mycobacterium sp. OTB74 TaxID=1853452 RepID=UPI002472F952|nr:thiolase family protein [Mycobacterium sp. OTB74]MDH6242716.1 acetyl-CoA acetyltransferase [Mycobacterium sp. OTB74]